MGRHLCQHPDSTHVFHGCYNKTTGALRLLDSAKLPAPSCTAASELAVTWNQTGPRGPAGFGGLNTNLSGAVLSNADLTGATFGPTASVTGTIWNNTICPDGRNSDGTDTSTCLGHGF